MITIALTGNIASGKSAVQKILEARNFKVLDTDDVGHELLESMQEVKTAFKDFDIFDTTGKIDREKLGQLIFNSPELKTRLENIIHPAIKSKIKEFFTKNESEKFLFVGIPLLFETNMTDLFDKILLIYTDDEIRKKRLIARNNFTPEYAEIRMNSQISQDKKKTLCDFVIYNNSSVTDLEHSVSRFIEQITKQ